jgi:uncharacterized protein
MILWDVNLWVYAMRSDSPKHLVSRAVMHKTLKEPGERFLFYPHIAASFLRVVTNPKIFQNPSTLQEAWSFIDVLANHPNAAEVSLGRAEFGIFKHLSLLYNTRGNLVPDILLAAAALQHNALLVTSNTDFTRFRELRVQIV